MNAPARCTFVFDTTTAALWAEDVARAAGIPVEVVPTPPASRAGCDLALIVPAGQGAALAAALDAAGVSYRPWPSGSATPPP